MFRIVTIFAFDESFRMDLPDCPSYSWVVSLSHVSYLHSTCERNGYKHSCALPSGVLGRHGVAPGSFCCGLPHMGLDLFGHPHRS